MSGLRHGTALRILRSFHELTPSWCNVGCTAATASGRPPARQVGVVFGTVAVPCLLPYTWAGTVGRDRRPQSCERISAVLPCTSRHYRRGVFRPVTNTQTLVVVKGPICDSDSHLSPPIAQLVTSLHVPILEYSLE